MSVDSNFWGSLINEQQPPIQSPIQPPIQTTVIVSNNIKNFRFKLVESRDLSWVAISLGIIVCIVSVVLFAFFHVSKNNSLWIFVVGIVLIISGSTRYIMLRDLLYSYDNKSSNNTSIINSTSNTSNTSN